jgi:hypothetical protein
MLITPSGRYCYGFSDASQNVSADEMAALRLQQSMFFPTLSIGKVSTTEVKMWSRITTICNEEQRM